MKRWYQWLDEFGSMMQQDVQRATTTYAPSTIQLDDVTRRWPPTRKSCYSLSSAVLCMRADASEAMAENRADITASSQTVFELFQVLQLLTDRLVILRQLVFDRWQLKHRYCRTTSIHSLTHNTRHNLYTFNSITPNLFYPRALTLMINSST